MRTRGKKQSSAKESNISTLCNEESETLAAISRDSVQKLVNRVNARNSKKNKRSNFEQGSVSKEDEKQVVETRVTWNDVDDQICEPIGGSDQLDDVDWEDGSSCKDAQLEDGVREIIIEFGDSPDSVKKKSVRRATAEDKEVAELVHKVHLLCLLARGRLIDSACDDPLIQASVLSLVPKDFLKIAEVSKLTANALSPIVHWFHNNFRIKSSASEQRSVSSALSFALGTQEGTTEEIAALFVALLRALKLTARFVSVLDATSRKPDLDRTESSGQGSVGARKGIFHTSTLMVDQSNKVSTSPQKASSGDEKTNVCETSSKSSFQRKDNRLRTSGTQAKVASVSVQVEGQATDALKSEVESSMGFSEHCSTNTSGSKRKGDLEFEMQLQMAMSATANATAQGSLDISGKPRSSSSPKTLGLKRIKRVTTEESVSNGISTAVGSKKVGSPLYWAEVYCDGENLEGKWVHLDAVNAIIDGEQKVEVVLAACRTSLRYAVAFAGRGAKDVTRRYCMKWYKIASQRTDPLWWNSVLAPLRLLESGATGGFVGLPNDLGTSNATHFSKRNSFAVTRETLEDMELETRALTEPLPTNQQAYRSHQLYAIERWLTETQLLHPKGPILGFCSGFPVYPRSCVQTLKTKKGWLREGLQVKANELPAKVLAHKSEKLKKVKFSEDDETYNVSESKGDAELYGKWQLEPLQLPPAVNGIVPKNERGQVELWSEKCLPPGTVHIRLPRVFNIAKRLELDYAPALVGFEFRNGRSYPVFDGIVVCTEFRDVILEACTEEEERREAEERRRNEAQALARWYQLLSSIVTRQRLNNRYGNNPSSQTSTQSTSKIPGMEIDKARHPQSTGHQIQSKQTAKVDDTPSWEITDDHEHVFSVEDPTSEDSLVMMKRCYCGFSIQVEEM